jgi:anionic cell wall polymer biosynthesis LytR-Cps2A-Psr (LCP) family protein
MVNISKKSFKKLSSFLNANIKYVKTELVLSERYEQIYDSIIEKNYKKFQYPFQKKAF